MADPAAQEPDATDGGVDHVHPDDVPAGFVVRAPGWLSWLLVVFALLNLANLFVAFDVVSLVLAVALTWAAATQRAWRAEVRPDGLRFTNRIGVDWERAWSDLRPDVEVRRPGRFGALVRGRLTTGRRVLVPNGRVTTLAGGTLAPETARSMMQAWADRGTAGGDAGADTGGDQGS